jgi:hypothetical protein
MKKFFVRTSIATVLILSCIICLSVRKTPIGVGVLVPRVFAQSVLRLQCSAWQNIIFDLSLTNNAGDAFQFGCYDRGTGALFVGGLAYIAPGGVDFGISNNSLLSLVPSGTQIWWVLPSPTTNFSTPIVSPIGKIVQFHSTNPANCLSFTSSTGDAITIQSGNAGGAFPALPPPSGIFDACLLSASTGDAIELGKKGGSGAADGCIGCIIERVTVKLSVGGIAIGLTGTGWAFSSVIDQSEVDCQQKVNSIGIDILGPGTTEQLKLSNGVSTQCSIGLKTEGGGQVVISNYQFDDINTAGTACTSSSCIDILNTGTEVISCYACHHENASGLAFTDIYRNTTGSGLIVFHAGDITEDRAGGCTQSEMFNTSSSITFIGTETFTVGCNPTQMINATGGNLNGFVINNANWNLTNGLANVRGTLCDIRSDVSEPNCTSMFQRIGYGPNGNTDNIMKCTMVAGTCTVNFTRAWNQTPTCVGSFDGVGTFTVGARLQIAENANQVIATSSTGTDTGEIKIACFGNPN